MTKQYIRASPVRLIGVELRNEDLGDLTPLYPCAIDADLVANIWLAMCSCGVEFTCHADKLISGEVLSCGQCIDTDAVQSEVSYLELADCYDLLKFG